MRIIVEKGLINITKDMKNILILFFVLLETRCIENPVPKEHS